MSEVNQERAQDNSESLGDKVRKEYEVNRDQSVLYTEGLKYRAGEQADEYLEGLKKEYMGTPSESPTEKLTAQADAEIDSMIVLARGLVEQGADEEDIQDEVSAVVNRSFKDPYNTKSFVGEDFRSELKRSLKNIVKWSLALRPKSADAGGEE